jgi:hypothetical protein
MSDMCEKMYLRQRNSAVSLLRKPERGKFNFFNKSRQKHTYPTHELINPINIPIHNSIQ